MITENPQKLQFNNFAEIMADKKKTFKRLKFLPAEERDESS